MTAKPFRIQYASRLFINGTTCLKQKLAPAPNAKYLVLAGNCVATDHPTTNPFLSYLSHGWEKVFIVPGPLEHSDLSGRRLCWQTQAEKLRKQAMFHKNVFICEQSIHRLPEFTLIATPLGGAYLGNPAELIAADPPLRYLSASGGNLFNKMRFINEEDITFLQDSLAQEATSEKPIVVATYQLPVIHLIGKDKEDVDIFTHYSTVSVTDSQYKYLVQGEYVEFELSESSNVHHQYQATNVKGINGGKLMCETRQTNRSVQNRPSSHPVSKTTSSIPKRRAPTKPEVDGFTTVSRTRPQKRGTSVNIKTI